MSKSQVMERTITLAKTFAKSEVPILIEGESGTGKELLAQSIHSESLRKEKSFVAFNCAAINDNLLESELFGYEAGSFTGAAGKGKIGIMEYANGGTLFLDEIEELSSEAQAKILRVLQEKEIMRVGSVKPIPVNIRIIVATNRNLRDMVDAGEFRRDLYYRLDVLRLILPPLRERKEDIIELILSFLQEKKCKVMMDKDIMMVINGYSWPGNVRELDNFVNYYANIYQVDIDDEDKKKYILEYFDRAGKTNGKVKSEKEVKVRIGIDREILNIIKEKSDLYHGVGRGLILDELLKRGISISEGKVKRILTELSNEILIIVGKGRAGSRITAKGEEYLIGLIKE
jgi:transcriptional regulator with PAS, ATPase and Fis domain